MARRFRFRTRATAMVRDLYATLEAAAIAAARRNNAALWYVPDSLGGVFQDLAGTALPALNAPIGLLLDRSFGVETLGPELVANGDFANGTAGWTAIYGGTATTSAAGVTLTTAASGYGGISRPITLEPGKTYVASCQYTELGGSGFFMIAEQPLLTNARQFAAAEITQSGEVRIQFVATIASAHVGVSQGYTSAVGLSAGFAKVSVREVIPAANLGPERIASTTDVSSAVWEKEKGAVGAGGLFTPTTESAIHRVAQRVGTGISTAGERVEATVKLKSNGIRYVYLNLNAGWGGQVGIDLTTGATVQNTATRVLPPTLDAEGFWTLTVQAQSVSGAAGSAYLWLQANNILAAGDATWAPNGTDGFYVKSASLRTVLGYHATQATAANKPTLARVPRKLGPNIVANGDFSSGTSGWPNSSVGSGTFTVTGGVANFSYTDASNYGRTVANAPTEAGKSYYLTGNVVSGTAYVGIVGAGGNMAGRFSRTTVATGPNTYIQIQSVSGATSVDDIEVREVLEWSYAIQFDASNDTLASNLPSAGAPGVIAFHNAGETVGYASASASGFTLGHPALAGRAVSVIVASPTAIAGGPDLDAVRAFANFQRGVAP